MPSAVSKKRKLWFTFQICGTTWSVYLVSPEVLAEFLHNKEGITVPSLAAIFIDRELANDRKPDVFFHELGHAVNFSMNVETRLKLRKGQEEDLVCYQAPGYYSAAVSLGFQLPPVPKGW